MPPPRLKLRTLTVLVALMALAVGAVEYRRRAAVYRELANWEETLETDAKDKARVTLAAARRGAVDAASATPYAQAAYQHARRRAAFLRCSRYPWLSPPADEPEPR